MEILRPVGIYGHPQGENIQSELIQSSDDDYSMDETYHRHTMPHLFLNFIKCHGIFHNNLCTLVIYSLYFIILLQPYAGQVRAVV